MDRDLKRHARIQHGDVAAHSGKHIVLLDTVHDGIGTTVTCVVGGKLLEVDIVYTSQLWSDISPPGQKVILVGEHTGITSSAELGGKLLDWSGIISGEEEDVPIEETHRDCLTEQSVKDEQICIVVQGRRSTKMKQKEGCSVQS